MLFTLRPARRDDWPFVWALRVATMRPLIERTYGWDEAMQRTFAEASLRGRVAELHDDVHGVHDARVGVLTVLDWEREHHLAWIAVIPTLQGRGLGAALVRIAQREAHEAMKPLTLQVLAENRAARFYERLGFVREPHDDALWVKMRWTAPNDPSAKSA